MRACWLLWREELLLDLQPLPIVIWNIRFSLTTRLLGLSFSNLLCDMS